MKSGTAFSDDTAVQRYFVDEESSPTRHEYTAGALHDMGGASSSHNRIAGNIFAAIHSHIREQSCEAFICDMKVRVNLAGADIFYYPDVMVCCIPTDNAEYFRHSPSVIFEVTSPSTERLDRGEKFVAYRSISALEQYVLVDSDQIRVTVFRRQREFVPEHYVQSTDVFFIDSIHLNLTLAGIYRKASC